MQKKILVVVTSVGKYPEQNKATGLWLGEAVHFVDKVQQAGYQVEYVSPEGGYTPIDPTSLEQATELDWQYYQDKTFMNQLGNTLRPNDINPDDYVAIYFAGGHGTVWDFPENKFLQALSQQIHDAGGYVTSVCHGAVGLLNQMDDEGEYLIKDVEVTGFSNEEEKLTGLDDQMPYLTETELVNRGAIYRKANEPWEEFAISDQRIITGQNPASAAKVADLLLAELVA